MKRRAYTLLAAGFLIAAGLSLLWPTLPEPAAGAETTTAVFGVG